MTRLYARAPRGKRVVISRPGKRYKRLNVVAGQCENEVVGETFYERTTNSRWFEVWFEWYFCPHLRQGSVVIMDNARFHRKAELERIAKFYGYSILWLPPYSPDKNHIEHLWANLKNWLRIHSRFYATIQLALLDYFKS
jgi:transposase